MKQIPVAFAILGLAAVLGAGTAVAQDRFRLDVTLTECSVDGSYTTFDPDATISRLDLDSNFGLEGADQGQGIRLAVSLTPRQKLVLDWAKMTDEGSDEVLIPLTVGGITTEVPAHLEASLELSSLRAGYAYAIVRTDAVTLDFLAGIELLDASASARATDSYLGLLTFSRSDSRDELGPVFGLMGDVKPFGRLSLDASVTYARLPLTSTDIKFLDAEAAVAVRLWSGLWARGGIRSIDVDVDDDDFTLDLTGRSVFLGATIRY